MSIDTRKLAIHSQLNLVCLELEQFQPFLTGDGPIWLEKAKQACSRQFNEEYALFCLVQWASRGFVDYPHIQRALDEADAVLKTGTYPPEPEMSDEEQVQSLKAKLALAQLEATPLQGIDVADLQIDEKESKS